MNTNMVQLSEDQFYGDAIDELKRSGARIIRVIETAKKGSKSFKVFFIK